MKLKIILLLMSLAFFSSCTLIPCNSTSGLSDLEEKVSKKNIIGNYKLDDWSQNLIPELKDSKAKLFIRKNGELEILNLPLSVLDNFSNENTIIKRAIGKWKFSEKFNENEIITQMIFAKEFESLNDDVNFWKIFSENDRLVIFIQFGDPDNCTAARFIKI